MIIMTLNALPKPLVIKSDFMHTRLKQLSLPRVTLATDIGYGGNAWWSRPVVAMAVVTRGSRKILSLVQRLGMHAPLVFVILISWYLELGHTRRITVAF
jgi:hypothetical protein